MNHYDYKGKKIRVGSMADRAIRLGKLADRHHTISVVTIAIVFWAAIYTAAFTAYPV